MRRRERRPRQPGQDRPRRRLPVGPRDLGRRVPGERVRAGEEGECGAPAADLRARAHQLHGDRQRDRWDSLVGFTADTGRIEVFYNSERVVDLPVDITYDDIPQHVYTDQTQTTLLEPLQLPDLPLRELLLRTLHLLSVGSKRFFVEKFDRSITGLIASQPVIPSRHSHIVLRPAVPARGRRGRDREGLPFPHERRGVRAGRAAAEVLPLGAQHGASVAGRGADEPGVRQRDALRRHPPGAELQLRRQAARGDRAHVRVLRGGEGGGDGAGPGGGECEGLGEHGGAHGERNGEGTVALSSRRRRR